jgi:hypothetical protein
VTVATSNHVNIKSMRPRVTSSQPWLRVFVVRAPKQIPPGHEDTKTRQESLHEVNILFEPDALLFGHRLMWSTALQGRCAIRGGGMGFRLAA